MTPPAKAIQLNARASRWPGNGPIKRWILCGMDFSIRAYRQNPAREIGAQLSIDIDSLHAGVDAAQHRVGNRSGPFCHLLGIDGNAALGPQ